MIDWSMIRTAGDRAEAERLAAAGAGRAECHRRILAVARETTQMNLAAAAAAGLLAPDDLAVYRQGLAWIAAMRATWRKLAEAGADMAADANWPAAPPEVIDLGRRW